MRTFLLFLAGFSGLFSCVKAQQLVPNNGFEQYQGIGKCPPWNAAEGSFNHFYHSKLNLKQRGAAQGAGYFALCLYGLEENEFLHVKLLQPLQKGKVYRLSMYVRMSDSSDDVYKNEHLEQLRRLDWYFTSIALNVREKLFITAEPSVSFPFAAPHPQQWTLLETEYTARGDEKYLTIGNITRMYELMQTDPEVWALREQVNANQRSKARAIDSVKAHYKAQMDPPVQNPNNAYSMNPYIKTKVSKKQEKAYAASVKKNNALAAESYAAERNIRTTYDKQELALLQQLENLRRDRPYYKVNVCFDEISIIEVQGKTAEVPDPLVSLEAVPGNTLVLKNVYFATDSYELLPDSYAELDRLAGWLGLNPGASLQVSGHTDLTGDEGHNLVLSQNRAMAVKAYLVSKGVDANRLNPRGYGSMFPLADNTSEQGKALNRRVEITVL